MYEENEELMECVACYSTCNSAPDGLCAGCRRSAAADRDAEDLMECVACYVTCKPAADGLCVSCRRTAVAAANRGIALGQPDDVARSRERTPSAAPKQSRYSGKAGKPYPWTRDQEDQVRQVYHRSRNRTILSREVTRLATSWGIPRYLITNHAAKIGICNTSWKPWTSDELAILREKSGILPIKKLAKELGRSPVSVKQKILKMNMSSAVSEGYSIKQLQDLLGVRHARIENWLQQGWLRREHDRITEASLRRFLFARMEEYSFRKCDESWLKGMLNENYGSRPIVRESRPEESSGYDGG